MMSLSLWSHLASLVAFIGMAVWLIKSQRDKRILAEMLGYPGKLVVEWPGTYLRHIASALDIPMTGPTQMPQAAPIKISATQVGEFFRQLHVSGISCKYDDGIIAVTMSVREPAAQAQVAQLEHAFQGTIGLNCIVEVEGKGTL